MKWLVQISLALLIPAFPFSGKAQTNLVPNPSFEIYSNCPTGVNSGSPDEVLNSTGWYSSLNTPDYFNSCAPQNVSVPGNNFGNQSAFAGSAYCGFWGYFKSSFYREIISTQLSIPLVSSQKYFASIRVSLAGNSQYSCCAIDKLGLKFTTYACNSSSPPPIDNNAQVYTLSKISDTTNWVLIFGSFIADSAYQYINIGNFFDDINTDTLNINNTSSISYYYVDDVKVSTDSLFCLSGVFENNVESCNQLYPNPTVGLLNISLPKELNGFDYELFDSVGNCIMNNKSNSNSITIDISEFSPGIYILKCSSKTNGIKVNRIVKIN